MAKSSKVSATPATVWLKQHGFVFSEHAYDYVDHGGANWAAEALGLPPEAVVKTLVMQDERAQPLVVLMHGHREVSTKQLARDIGVKSVEPCRPEVAQRHSGYMVGGTSPFGLKKPMPVWVQASVLTMPLMYINGGRRGYLVGLAPEAALSALGARAVDCAMAE
jgi:Cys-tRNA(Pro) deacylase